MFTPFSPNPLNQAPPNSKTDNLPDPWDIPQPPEMETRMPPYRPINLEVHHLLNPHPPVATEFIAPASAATLPRLSAPTGSNLSPTQVLLTEELKLKACDDHPFADNVVSALALLSWMGTATPA